jgi:hypothetical protein
VDFKKLTHTERTIIMLKQLLLIFLSLVFFNASAQMGGGGSSRGQSIPSDSSSGKNNIELMQQEMMGAIVITCQENLNKECAINETVKSIVNTACGKEKSREEKDGCFTIAEQILSGLLNNISSQERQIYQKIYNQQPHIVEKIKKQNDDEEIKKALIKIEQDDIKNKKLAEIINANTSINIDNSHNFSNKIELSYFEKKDYSRILIDLVSLILIIGTFIYMRDSFNLNKKTEVK